MFVVRTPFILGLMALFASGCGDNPTPPRIPSPGTLTVRLDSPAGPESAARFRLIGGGIREILASEGRVFSALRGDTADVVVVLQVPGDVRFRLTVADTADLPSMTVVEVAGPDNTLRVPGGYSLETGG
jgi:hypothetical protein